MKAIISILYLLFIMEKTFATSNGYDPACTNYAGDPTSYKVDPSTESGVYEVNTSKIDNCEEEGYGYVNVNMRFNNTQTIQAEGKILDNLTNSYVEYDYYEVENTYEVSTTSLQACSGKKIWTYKQEKESKIVKQTKTYYKVYHESPVLMVESKEFGLGIEHSHRISNWTCSSFIGSLYVSHYDSTDTDSKGKIRKLIYENKYKGWYTWREFYKREESNLYNGNLYQTDICITAEPEKGDELYDD